MFGNHTRRSGSKRCVWHRRGRERRPKSATPRSSPSPAAVLPPAQTYTLNGWITPTRDHWRSGDPVAVLRCLVHLAHLATDRRLAPPLAPQLIERELQLLLLRLRGPLVGDPKHLPNPFNARVEGIRDKPMFADRLDSGRGLIPAGGFYERLTVGKQKSPHHFRLRSGDAFAFAGLFDFWRSDDAAIFLTCLITTEANDVVKPVHDRMPVVLAGESEFSRWLDPAVHAGDVLPMLRPFPAGAMEVVRVGPAVGKATNQWPACIEPAVWSASLDSRVTKETSETNS